MKIIAHRGASRECPENTLPAFRRAVEIGVDEIETDLVETRDGVVLLHHDETLRCGTQRVPIGQLTLAEVKKINPAVPTLNEVLEVLGSQVSFCLEFKGAGLAEHVAALVRKYGLGRKTHFTSFRTADVAEIKKLCPESDFSWTFLTLPEGAAAELKRAGMNAVSLSSKGVSHGIIRQLLEDGIKTRVYTVNDTALAAQYETWGIDAIFTDDPARMQGFRKR